MSRCLVICLSVILFTLCFITSCKEDSTPVKTSIDKKHAEKEVKSDKSDLVIRDDKTTVEESNDVTEQQCDSSATKELIDEHVEEVDNCIYEVAEVLPQYPGGVKALNEYIEKKIASTELCTNIKSSLRTMISFIVERDGSLSDISIAKSSGNSELDAAAIKFVTEMPRWSPASNDGVLIRMKYIVPVVFKPINNK